ncbi:MAG: GNAT family N-acetyltransferase [Ruminococcaceae bacterium]|nr:GNAT family N-acetyltransferase [Oscillospiraceae bacterium]
MDIIRLTEPSMAYARQIEEFRREVMAAQDASAFAGCSWLEEYDTAEAWLAFLARERDPATRTHTPADTRLAVRESDHRLVGIIDLRHHIDHPILRVWGGHMGYTVRPSERRKGYAGQMLRLNLVICREMGMEKILITCNENNVASEKTILSCGGIYESTVEVGKSRIKRFWITL